MKPTQEQIEFVRKVADYIANDDHNVRSWERKICGLTDKLETEIKVMINPNTKLTISLSEPEEVVDGQSGAV